MICSKKNCNYFIIITFHNLDNLPYTTLTYANGAGANAEDNKNPDGSRKDLTKFQFRKQFRLLRNNNWYTRNADMYINKRLISDLDKDYRYAAAVPTKIESHGGDDVGVFALGSHPSHSIYEF